MRTATATCRIRPRSFAARTRPPWARLASGAGPVTPEPTTPRIAATPTPVPIPVWAPSNGSGPRSAAAASTSTAMGRPSVGSPPRSSSGASRLRLATAGTTAGPAGRSPTVIRCPGVESACLGALAVASARALASASARSACRSADDRGRGARCRHPGAQRISALASVSTAPASVRVRLRTSPSLRSA